MKYRPPLKEFMCIIRAKKKKKKLNRLKEA